MPHESKPVMQTCSLCPSWPGCWAPQGPSRGELSSRTLQSGVGGSPQSHGLALLLSSVTPRPKGGLWRGAPGGPSRLLHPLLTKLLKTVRGVGWGPTLKWQKLVGRPESLPNSRRQQPCKGKEGKISSKWMSELPTEVTALRIWGQKARLCGPGWGRCSQGAWTPEWELGPSQQRWAGPR